MSRLGLLKDSHFGAMTHHFLSLALSLARVEVFSECSSACAVLGKPSPVALMNSSRIHSWGKKSSRVKMRRTLLHSDSRTDWLRSLWLTPADRLSIERRESFTADANPFANKCSTRCHLESLEEGEETLDQDLDSKK